jgi:undecaprenyl-diphosphatase
MSIFEAIILGLTQGLTEFLPVSSSGHLVIIPSLFGFSAPNLTILAAMHFGTLVAVVVFFRRDILDIIRIGCGRDARYEENNRRYGKKTLWLLGLANIPAAIAGWWFESSLAENAISSTAIATSIFAIAVMLWFSERYSSGRLSFANITGYVALLIGIAQTFALLPGISRSGATIAMGLFLGLSRTDAARFSFLMAIPISIGALIVEFPNIVEKPALISLGIAMAIAFVVAYMVIASMLRYIEHVRYGVFVWYGVALAALTYFFV